MGLLAATSSALSVPQNLRIAAESMSPSFSKFPNPDCSHVRLCNRIAAVEFASRQALRIPVPRIIGSSASDAPLDEGSQLVRENSVSVILLAGGRGKRMGASMPKQYLPLLGQPIALYSLYTFSQLREVKEIIVVCDPSYENVFKDTEVKVHVDLKFALPGKERQDSVYSGLQAVDENSELVCVHDSARPLVSSGDVKKEMAWTKDVCNKVGTTLNERKRIGYVGHVHGKRKRKPNYGWAYLSRKVGYLLGEP